MKYLTGIIAGLAGLCLSVCVAATQDFPDRTVRFIVPNPPGGGTDVVARLVAEGVGQRWGQSVIVENKPGGGGNIGAQFVARSDPDGYVLFLISRRRLNRERVPLQRSRL